ncbi:hypothetical protein [Pseudoalteromonas obscura]|uniref:Uncharacterized protein n=1 Tax=Pseudoalteromonas obscura TaxID=3048491 RepID=A0ABT7EUJ3_9GAMM|nr:hypothetical protein [Pseudoalteromonas sp. P94(2023)]MDK2598668.1 hypothetical protein [Pseudoalteromonas sp. P94(2023)]
MTVKLRFLSRYSSEGAHSPIKLRFGSDVELKHIINYFEPAWDGRGEIERDLETPSGAARCVELQFNDVFTRSHEIESIWGVSLLGAVGVWGSCRVQYSIAQKSEQNYNILGSETDLLEIYSECPFSVSVTKIKIFSALFAKSKIVRSTFKSYWSFANNISEYTKFSYGPEKPIYVCRFKSHLKPGYVKLRMRDKRTLSTDVLKMRFTASEKVCHWTLGGGPIRSDDDIPTLDRKIPVEPQLQSSYIMTPSIKCVRLNDGQSIAITSFSYSFSRGQFAASGNIRFMSRIDMERALGETLKLTINGYEFVMLCEQSSTSRKFANSSFSASLRSRFAELSEPYARETNYTNKEAKTLEGLMSEVLSNSGWTVQSKLIDFPVPASAYSYQGLTPAAALLQITKSVGAILTFDDVTKKVDVMPEWPVAPWDTTNATCDVIINDSLIIEHSTRQTINPEHNAIFVRGEQIGVACKIKRTGTTGSSFAPDIVDSLMTHNQAARQRGTCELARSGAKQINRIKTKLLPTLPPFKPGMLVGIRYTDSLYKATCESVAISASVNAQGAITVSQDIEVLSNV